MIATAGSGHEKRRKANKPVSAAPAMPILMVRISRSTAPAVVVGRVSAVVTVAAPLLATTGKHGRFGALNPRDFDRFPDCFDESPWRRAMVVLH